MRIVMDSDVLIKESMRRRSLSLKVVLMPEIFRKI